MDRDTIPNSQFNQIKYPAKASRVKILVTGTASAWPTNVPDVVSSFMMDVTTIPGWVFR